MRTRKTRASLVLNISVKAMVNYVLTIIILKPMKGLGAAVYNSYS